MNAVPSLKPANETRPQHAFDGLAAAGFDFEAAHREGWTVAEAEANTDGSPGVQLQRLDGDVRLASLTGHESFWA